MRVKLIYLCLARGCTLLVSSRACTVLRCVCSRKPWSNESVGCSYKLNNPLHRCLCWMLQINSQDPRPSHRPFLGCKLPNLERMTLQLFPLWAGFKSSSLHHCSSGHFLTVLLVDDSSSQADLQHGKLSKLTCAVLPALRCWKQPISRCLSKSTLLPDFLSQTV